MNKFVNSQVSVMKPYLPPLEGRRKYKGVLCDFNERTIPTSPKVRAAIRAFAGQNQVQFYPEYGDELLRKIAAYAKVKPWQVMVTNGSDQGIDLIFRAFTSYGDKVVIPTPSFAMFPQCAGMVGNKVVEPTYKLPDLEYPINEVLNEIENGAKLVVICNPNNPTGTLLSLVEIEQILTKAAEKSCIVYIDEAYSEFSGITAAPLIKKYPNLIITRTFSKAFGLASLRVGYVLSDENNIAELRKVLGPYDVNMAGYAAACAALDDVKETQKYVDEVMEKAKPMVESFFKKQKIPFYPSRSNFVLFKPQNASLVYEKLREKSILVRPRGGPNIDGTLRVTMGTVSQMKKFISVYEKFILEKCAFLDRDGALIYEPEDTKQIDRLDQLKILPGVIKGLQKLRKAGYSLIMVSNQDGIGSPKYPQENFDTVQNRLIEIFKENGIEFAKIFICPHFLADECACRKPKTGLVKNFMAERCVNMEKSFMYGDRDTDRQFADNLGIRFIKAKTNGSFKTII